MFLGNDDLARPLHYASKCMCRMGFRRDVLLIVMWPGPRGLGIGECLDPSIARRAEQVDQRNAADQAVVVIDDVECVDHVEGSSGERSDRRRHEIAAARHRVRETTC